jgi:hypothetical protein
MGRYRGKDVVGLDRASGMEGIHGPWVFEGTSLAFERRQWTYHGMELRRDGFIDGFSFGN